jgi:hypothetical protein
MTLLELESRYPLVSWREPQRVTLAGDGTAHYLCRVCVANHGLHRGDIPKLPTDPSTVRRHIEVAHVAAEAAGAPSASPTGA